MGSANAWYNWATECWNTKSYVVLMVQLGPDCLAQLGPRWFYCVFAPKCWKSIGFTVFSLQNVEKAMVLLCFRSKMLKNQWFYCGFDQKWWNTIGFTMFSLKHIEKTIGFTVKPIPATASHGFGIWCSNTRLLETLWGTLTAKLLREKSSA